MGMTNVPGGFKVEEFEPLPRRDLCEPAFRKFEGLIIRALREDFVIDPRDVGMKLSARTFVARFNDAKRGYMVYGYKSEGIGKFNLMFIKATVGKNERVLIYNEFGKSALALVNGLAMPQAMEKRETPEMNVAINWFEGVDRESLEATVVNFEDLEHFKKMLEQDEKTFLGQWVTVVCNNALEVIEAKKVQEGGFGRSTWLHVVRSKEYKEKKV